MPSSFIGTGEPGSMSVFPSTNFADPRLFGGVYPALGAGIKQGVDLSGELQQHQLAAAMMPLQIQHAQNLAAMDPIALQQAQVNLAKSGMPIITDKTTRPVKIDRKTGKIVDDTTPEEPEVPREYNVNPDTGALEETPDSKAMVAATTPPPTPYDTVEMETGNKLNPLTGEKTPYTTFGKTIETDEDRQKREAATAAQKQEAEARIEAAKAATARAKLGANRVYPAQSPIDGKVHAYKDEIDADGNVVQRDLGADLNAAFKNEQLKTKSELNMSQAAHQDALADAVKTGQTVNKTRDAVIAKAAAAYDLPADKYVELTKTFKGRTVLAAIYARKTGATGSTVPSPEEDPATQSALDDVYHEPEAAPAPAEPLTGPNVTAALGNTLGAPVEDNGEQAAPAPAAAPAPQKVPIVHPSRAVYDAMQPGDPYIENGVTYHKPKKNQ